MLDNIESQISLLEFKCRRPVEHLLAGKIRSVFRGSGIEFEDVRSYQPGDDVRAMDWRVTARTGEPHIKRFIEEREQHFYLLVDASASMRHDPKGRTFKTVRDLSAMLTFAAIKNHDRIGLMLFTDIIEHITAPGKGRSHAMRLLTELVEHEPAHQASDLNAVLHGLGRMIRKHSIIFILSDFLFDVDLQELQMLSNQHQVFAIHVSEKPLPADVPNGLIHIADSETGEREVIELRRGKGSDQQHRKQIRDLMMSAGVDHLEVEAGSDVVEALAQFFHAQQRKAVDETGG
ncbi:MAG: DUF58 domain-containing protein [Verrucomicrobiota bacterium]